MNRYQDFLLEKAISESALYISPALDSLLSQIDSPIAKDLLSMIGSDIKPDATFLDIGEKEGEITFTTMRNAKKRLGEIYGDGEFMKSIEDPESRGHKGPGDVFWAKAAAQVIYAEHPDFWKASRNPARIGRLIGQIFPGKYSNPEIEKFVNQFKAKGAKDEKFILAEGEDIDKWYWHENYLKVEGDLGRSCMAKKKGLFGIYVQNPEKVRLLVLLEDGKAKGRALVWKVDSNKYGIEYYMDRQYTIEQSDVEKFRSFAKEKGWAYKSANNHHSAYLEWKGEVRGLGLEVTLKKMRYEDFPYMDSFKRFDPSIAVLHNDDDRDEEFEGQYILDDTGGGYTEIESGVYSEWHGRNIPSDQSVWCEAYGDYILDRYAVYIEGRGYFHEDDDAIVYCEWEDRSMHEEDCRYSEHESEWISKARAVRAVTKVYSDGSIQKSWFDDRDDKIAKVDTEMAWHKILSSKNSDWTIRYTSGRTGKISYLLQDIAERWKTREGMAQEGTYYPAIFKRYVYRVVGVSENPRLPEEYMKKLIEDDASLSIADCKMLGFERAKDEDAADELWMIDDFEYHERLSNAGPEGDSLLSRMIDLLVNDLIPNTESIADEGEEDMKKIYEERLERIWGMMGIEYKG